MKNFCKIFFLILFSANAFALSPERHLSDESQEQRALKIFIEVKCLVCAAQSIESSNTEFSKEMRELIREKISLGKNDDEIRNELTKEFGENILKQLVAL